VSHAVEGFGEVKRDNDHVVVAGQQTCD